jgi:hypothetical protein
MTDISQEDILLYAMLSSNAYNEDIRIGDLANVQGSGSYRVIGAEYGTLTSFGG